jgi:hypothetical protein
MKKKIKVGYQKDYFSHSQLEHLEEELLDVELEEFMEEADLWKALEEERILAVAKNMSDLPFYKKGEKYIIGALIGRLIEGNISLREEIPSTSTGIIGLVTLSSQIENRRTLAELNEDDTMYCSNVERRLKQHFPSAKICCHLDRANRYNLGLELNINGESKQFFLTQSTFVGLVDKMVTQIMEG